MVGQAQYVEGVLQGVGEVDTVCMEGVLEGWTGINPGCSRTKQLSPNSAGEARKDGIRV